MRVRRSGVLIAVVTLLVSVSVFGQDKMDLKNVFHETKFQVVFSSREIVSDIRKKLCEVLGESRIADPTESFAAGCVRGEGDTSVRLIFAGHRKDLWFVLYEQGGIAYSRMLTLFRTENGQVRVVWNGRVISDAMPPDLKALKELISRGDFQ